MVTQPDYERPMLMHLNVRINEQLRSDWARTSYDEVYRNFNGSTAFSDALLYNWLGGLF